MIFSWDDENREHLRKHAVTPSEAEHIVNRAATPFPQKVGDGKLRVWGRTKQGRLLQVIYVLKPQSAVAFESVDILDWAALEDDPQAKIARVIHAMDLTDDMKRQLRRLRR